MAPSDLDFLLGEPQAQPAINTYNDLQRRKEVVLGSPQCHVSSSLAPHAPILDVLAAMDKAADYCEAEAKKEEGFVDPENVGSCLRNWYTQLWNVLADLNIAEEQRAADVFKAVDWYNRNLAKQENYLQERAKITKTILEHKHKQELEVMEGRCARRLLACEAENTKLKEEIQRLRSGVAVTEEKPQDSQEDNLFAEMLVDSTD